MSLEKINMADLEKELGEPIPAQELALIPEQHRQLAVELRTNNNRLKWLMRNHVACNNAVVDHDRLLSPVRILAKVLVTLAGGGLLLVVVEIIKLLLKRP